MDQHRHHIDAQHHSAPGSATLSGGPVLVLTGVAVEKVREIMAREGLTQGGLRVAVVGGGCSGFQYNLTLDEHAREDDTVIEQDGVRVFIDPASQQYLSGVTLDY
ncbi:MAG: iron-sulfur cluster assembly accessory protein, partial [Candidatus Binatia bacterium]|nr:iron-sulfur cluster assembly accessory protein [Candidatus Binatia bacterium]